ncbi:MAG: PD-(D/E)XK nuclease family protein, partial [Nitrospirae bacterium]|nr:PD-(D/E)XK nuclease family protein [Nitrospirota bacterium]
GIDEIRLDFRDVFYMLNIPDTVTGVVMDALDTFKAYQSFIRNNGLLDEDDLIKVCPRYIKDIKDSNEMGALIIDGFYNPTVAEKNVLRELIHNYKHTFIAMPYDPAFYGLTKDYIEFLKENALIEEALLDKDISDISSVLNYYSYPDIEEEVEGIARNIKALYVSGKVKALEEISVVFPELNDYSAMVERIFRRYGIPYNILMRKSLGGMRPFLDLLCLLSSLAEGYPRLKFSQFLSSNYFSRIPGSLRKWIPLISVQSGIISGKTAWLDFISSGSEVLDISLLPERSSVEKDLNWVFERLQPLEDVKTGATFTTYAMLLKKLLDDFGFPGPLNKPSAKKIFEATNELIAQLSFLGTLNPAPVTLPEFEEALRHLLHASYVETEGNGVRVMDFSGVQGLTPRYLFFGGLSDANMPERQGMDYMLPDNVKMKMGFLHLDKYNLIQKFGFASIIKASEHLHLSYPLMDGDTVFLPSSFLYSGEEVKERLPGIFSKEEYLVRTGNEPLLNYMAEVRVHPSLLRIPSYLRVTDIDAYRACPRRFFIEKILRLTPLSVKEYEIEAATLGTIIHKVMEKLVQEPLKEMEQTETRTGEIIEEILKDKKMDAYWKRLIKDTFIEMLPEIYEKELEIREAGYVSTEVEKSISGEPLKGIKLRGKIDRIDKIGDYVQIIDYKTGTA